MRALRPDAPAVLGRVSIVVPTKDSARTLEACLRSARAQAHADVEVIVVDNASTDATPAIAAAHAHRVITAGPERSAQRNVGAAAATGEHVVFVDSDMVLTPEVAGDVVATFASSPGLSGLVIPERAFGEGFLAACRVLEKELYVGVAEVEAARAFRRDAVLAVGGYDPELTAHEDWDLPDRLAAAGGGIGRISAWVDHDEGRISLARQFRKKRYYGRWTRRYVQQHGGQALRRMGRTSLFDRPGRLAADPVHAAGLIVLKAVEAAGVLAGAALPQREA